DVVFAQVEHDRDVRPERVRPLELEGGELDHVRRAGPRDGRERRVVVAACYRVNPGVAQHVAQPQSRRALAGRAGDPDVAAAHPAPGPLDLTGDVHASLPQVLQVGMVDTDAGRGHAGRESVCQQLRDVAHACRSCGESLVDVRTFRSRVVEGDLEALSAGALHYRRPAATQAVDEQVCLVSVNAVRGGDLGTDVHHGALPDRDDAATTPIAVTSQKRRVI